MGLTDKRSTPCHVGKQVVETNALAFSPRKCTPVLANINSAALLTPANIWYLYHYSHRLYTTKCNVKQAAR